MTVYFSEDVIYILLGKRGKKVKIMACQTYLLHPGTLINDVVTKDDQLKEILIQIQKKYPEYKYKVRLVLGNSRIMTKTMQVPSLSGKHLLNIAERELRTCYHITEDMVYDYSVIKTKNSNNKGGTILAVAVRRELIDTYAKLFAECGMKLKEADITLNAILSLTQNMRHLDRETYILSVLEGRSILSYVFVDGEYMHYNRYRFVSEGVNQDAGKELLGHYSALIQFNQSQRTGEEIRKIFFCGISEEQEAALYLFLRSELGGSMEVERLDGADTCETAPGVLYRLCDYPFVTGTLYRKRYGNGRN